MRFPQEGGWAANTVVVETTQTLLTISVSTDDEQHLAKNCDSIAKHLRRFAGPRETLAIEWIR